MESNTGTRRMLHMVISILVGMALWFIVDSANQTEVTITVENIMVEYVGEETALAERGLLLLDDSDQYVTLQLRGVRSLISKLDPDEMRVEADLSGITEIGEQSVDYYEIFPSSDFSDITVVDQSPYTVKVNIGDLYSKEVPMRCEIQGAVAEGYSAGAIEMSIDTIEVRGLQESVETVSYAKVVLEIDEATRSVNQTLEYEFYDIQGNLLDKEDLQTEVGVVDVVMPVNLTKQIRLVVEFEEAAGAKLSNVSYTLSPEYITVTGDAEEVERMNVLLLDTFNLLDLSGSATHHYTITLPEGVENLSGYSKATMQIAFEDMQNVTLTSENYNFTNIPEGKIATVVSSAVGVRIFGTTANVEAVLAENVVLHIDLSDYSGASGTYTVPATVELNTTNDVGLLGTYQVQVNIEDEPEEVPEEDIENAEDGTQQESEDDTSSDN